ncbi:MAG: hypothetical protein V1777_03700 [Candidatus Micrarchaeota archaeon]
MWKGIVIEESLTNPNVLWETQLLKVKVSGERLWHLQTVFCDKKAIEKIQKELKVGFYAHFWDKKNLIVAFPKQAFQFKKDNAEERKKAIEYGKQQGIPEEQLTFPTE